MKLIFNNQVLQDSYLITHYQLKDESTIVQDYASLSSIPGIKVQNNVDDCLLLYTLDEGVVMPCSHPVCMDSMRMLVNNTVKQKQYHIKCPQCKAIWDTNTCIKICMLPDNERAAIEEKLADNYIFNGMEC